MNANLTRLLLAAAVAALVVAAPASAKTYRVSGKQIAVNENAGKYRMTGGLVGKWKMTSFKTIATAPIYRAKGTEKFDGCLDRRRDGHCAGDPRGTIRFDFLYWGLFGPGDSLVWGSCWHPVTGGTGDFGGARGVLTFVDTPTAKGVKTAYIGNLTLGASRHSRRAARSGASASAGHACGQA
jgi:hypothetical protein